jgi:hypothetical protein
MDKGFVNDLTGASSTSAGEFARYMIRRKHGVLTLFITVGMYAITGKA